MYLFSRILFFKGLNIKVQDKFEKIVEKFFFKGNSTKWSRKLAFIIGNLFLMGFLFLIVILLILYPWTGSLYPEGSGYRLDFLGDNFIPFVPEMAIFYVYLFYPLVVIVILYFTFIESEKGYALGWSLFLTSIVSIAIYIVFPVSTYWWRQELLANKIKGNFWADTMYSYYSTDSSFNCLPSLHASISTIIFFVWYQYYKIKANVKTKVIMYIILFITIGTILSTLFVKQHYIIDEITGVALAYLISRIIFRKCNSWNE